MNQYPTLHELPQQNFYLLKNLFDPVDYSLSIRAAIEGNNPGRIFVDDITDARTAFALTVEGYFLVGDHLNQDTTRALKRFLQEKIFTGEIFVNGDESMSLAVHPDTWQQKLPDLIPDHEIEKINRYHYICDQLNFEWRDLIPEGYRLQRVNRELIEDTSITFPEALREWIDIEEMWWNLENFLSTGVSYAILKDNEVVSWCTPDCAAGDRIDIGIITHPDHRRRGLASIAVAATVEQCFNQGFRAVGWHCNAINIGSWKTAEKVGFYRKCEYDYYYYMYDPVDHLAELGWHYYQQGEYERTVQYYGKVFDERGENPDYYYHLAASAWAHLGNVQQALKYLEYAANHGWRNAQYTKNSAEFHILHSEPQWQVTIEKMEGEADE